MEELSRVHFQSCLISLGEGSPGTLAAHPGSVLLHSGCCIPLLGYKTWWGGDWDSEARGSCAWSQCSYCSSTGAGWLPSLLSAESCAGFPKYLTAAGSGASMEIKSMCSM